MYIYLDESGDLRRSDTKYFIVGTFTVGDSRRIVKAFRKWQKSKFPKKLKGQAEIKFNDPHIDDKLRFKTIKYLAKQDIRIFYTFLDLTNVPENFRKDGKVYETGLLYTQIVAATFELYLPITENEFKVIRDRRTLKGVTPAQFKGLVSVHLLPQLPPKVVFDIQAVDSTSNPLVQVADWVSGALARYYEGKEIGQELYDELKRNIIEEKELFKDYWTKKWEK